METNGFSQQTAPPLPGKRQSFALPAFIAALFFFGGLASLWLLEGGPMPGRWSMPWGAPWPPPPTVMVPAERIMAALEEFNEVNGRYPESLDELIPKHLDSIPPAEWGSGNWGYWTSGERNEVFHFEMKRSENSYEGYYYDSDVGEWGYDG